MAPLLRTACWYLCCYSAFSPLCIVPVPRRPPPPPPPLQGLHGLILQKCRSCRMKPCCNFGRTCS